MYVVQYLTLIVVAYLLFHLALEYRRGRIDWSSFISWVFIMTIFGIVSLFPIAVSTEIKNLLGLGRGLDALFVVSIGLAYVFLFKLYVKIDRTEREITELTRKIAIELEEINERLKKMEEGG